jgi:hypothetical protein
MPTTPARNTGAQTVHFLRKSISYLDDGKTVTIGTLPAGAVVAKAISGVHVHTAFNGGTTNTLDLGPSTDTGTNLWATLLALGAVTFVPLDEAVTNLVLEDTVVQAKVVSTASASAGAAEIVIAYIPDNDG